MTKRIMTPLENTLGGCLHQDWDLHYADETAATLAAARGENVVTLRQAVEQLDVLIADGASSPEGESDLAQECLRLGLYFDPTGVGLTYVQWLTRVRSVFQQELDTRASGSS